MKKIFTFLTIGLLSTVVYADEKMSHSSQVNNNERGILHVKNKPYHHMEIINGYKVMLSSQSPIKRGINNLTVVILKNKKPIKDLDINIEFTSSDKILNATPLLKGNAYTIDVNFDTIGHWMYSLDFKTKNQDNIMKGNMNIL